MGTLVAPERIFLWTVDGVVLTFHQIHRETKGKRLAVGGLRNRRGVHLASGCLRFRPGNILGLGQRKKIAEFRGVQEILRVDGSGFAVLLACRTVTLVTRSPEVVADSGA